MTSTISTLLALLIVVMGSLSPVLAGFVCDPGNLAVYKVRLDTFWSETRFPKQYPEWRPPAQWSKTVGYVHDSSISLFKMGDKVSSGVREFVETGEADKLDQEYSGRSYLDSILVPPIPQGAGSTTANIFVDGNHSMVSMITKIVPSPDWFIGLDSLQLCRDNQFIEQLSLQVDPLDAGTDNGFTFTSPNWPTEPQGSVFKITSTYPPHPAGSFNYPHLSTLPTLAVFTFTKEREYQLNRDHDVIKKFISINKDDETRYLYHQEGEKKHSDDQEVISFVPYEASRSQLDERQITTNEIDSEPPQSQPSTLPGSSQPSTSNSRQESGLKLSSAVLAPSIKSKYNIISQDKSTGYHASTSPDSFFKKKYRSPYLTQAEDVVFHKKLDSNKKNTLMSLLNSMKNKSSSSSKSTTLSLRKKKRLRRNRHKKRSKKPRNCQVSSWSEWSACSVSCGIGESVRTRTILKHPRHGGHHCPKLRDYKWCGSARNCKTTAGYFNW